MNCQNQDLALSKLVIKKKKWEWRKRILWINFEGKNILIKANVLQALKFVMKKILRLNKSTFKNFLKSDFLNRNDSFNSHLRTNKNFFFFLSHVLNFFKQKVFSEISKRKFDFFFKKINFSAFNYSLKIMTKFSHLLRKNYPYSFPSQNFILFHWKRDKRQLDHVYIFSFNFFVIDLS